MRLTDCRHLHYSGAALWTLGRSRYTVQNMSPEQIIDQLRAHFSDARCDIVDLTGTKDHYELHIASEHFRGLSQLEVHRLVYSALGPAVGTSIHALSVKACLPERWVR